MRAQGRVNGVPRRKAAGSHAARSDEARARAPGRGRGARGEIELPEDVGQVPVHRVLAQYEPLSDFRVAQRLVLSEHTVHRHLANILRKLDLSSRAAAAAWGTRAGLI